MSETLAMSLQAGRGLDHPAGDAALIETHISWVVLAGDFAYKLKKPVKLDFLDFSTLEARHFYCEEELRLNRRTAPDIYLEVLPISGTERDPCVGDPAQPFEYALKMRRFDHSRTLDRVVSAGEFTLPLALALADAVADFHRAAERAVETSEYLRLEAVKGPSDDNFTTTGKLLTADADRRDLADIAAWAEAFFEANGARFSARARAGCIRECHGDLHLRNIFLQDGRCTLFDCIEFDPALRWIDTAADLAFLLMDMAHAGEERLANLMYNEYLQRSGDFDSAGVIDFYLVYRAMVRAKIDAIRAGQSGDPGELADCRAYLALAQRFTVRPPPRMVIMCGLSGTGKTTVARELAAELGAIHLRSDVERKRLFDLDMHAPSSERGLDIYTQEATQRTFARLEELASMLLQQGHSVVVDATFIQQHMRAPVESVAQRLNVPWCIVECTLDEAEARRRLQARTGDASEAGVAQYEDQCRHYEGVSAEESRRHVAVDTAKPVSATRLLRLIEERIADKGDGGNKF